MKSCSEPNWHYYQSMNYPVPNDSELFRESNAAAYLGNETIISLFFCSIYFTSTGCEFKFCNRDCPKKPILMFFFWKWFNSFPSLYMDADFQSGFLNLRISRYRNFSRNQFFLNLQAPIAQKIADEVIFRRFQGEGVEFFVNRTSLTPRFRFFMRFFEKIPIKALPVLFFSGFYIKIIFWVRWFYNLFERMRL